MYNVNWKIRMHACPEYVASCSSYTELDMLETCTWQAPDTYMFTNSIDVLKRLGRYTGIACPPVRANQPYHFAAIVLLCVWCKIVAVVYEIFCLCPLLASQFSAL